MKGKDKKSALQSDTRNNIMYRVELRNALRAFLESLDVPRERLENCSLPLDRRSHLLWLIHPEPNRFRQQRRRRRSDGIGGRAAGVGQPVADKGEEGQTDTAGIGGISAHAGPRGAKELHMSDEAPWLGASPSESSNSHTEDSGSDRPEGEEPGV